MGLETVNWQLLTYSFLHDIAIAVYIGGSIAMEYVLGPAQEGIPPAQAQVMGEKTSSRFLKFVWVSLGFIVVTGVLRLAEKGFVVADMPPFRFPLAWDQSYGRTVFAMALIWTVLVINGLLITFVFRPRLVGRAGAGITSTQVTARQDSAMQAAQWVQRLTRTDLVLSLLAALLGASLVLGGVL
jgi:uncharacterized membrane protein